MPARLLLDDGPVHHVTSPSGRVPRHGRLRRADGAVRALVVDDEWTLSELLSVALRLEGCEVRTAGDGTSALAIASDFEPDIVLLDVMLPDLSGLDVLARLHRERPGLPVLLVTAMDSVEDRVAGLNAGGADYVTKPFSLDEMIARVRALLRRSIALSDEEPVLVAGDLVLNEATHEATRGDDRTLLSETEFALLRYLISNPRRVLSRESMAQHIWHSNFTGTANIVETYISYLRKKVDLPGHPPTIHTVRGIGYVFKPNEPDD